MAVPASLTDGSEQPAGKRFNVYRNNVIVSLKEALSESFPVVTKLSPPLTIRSNKNDLSFLQVVHRNRTTVRECQKHDSLCPFAIWLRLKLDDDSGIDNKKVIKARADKQQRQYYKNAYNDSHRERDHGVLQPNAFVRGDFVVDLLLCY